MALFEIQRVEVAPRKLTARVHLADGAPLMTNEDLEGTSRVYYLVPGVVDHVCLGDGGESFRDVMGATELAHLLEHVTVELLAQTDIAGDITSGRTFAVEGDDRSWDIELSCPDDVLVAGALSSAAWMLEWAYGGGEGPQPDVDGIVNGLVGLVESLPEPEPQQVEEGAVLVDELSPEEFDESAEELDVVVEDEVEATSEEESEAEPESEEPNEDEAELTEEPEVANDDDTDEELASEDAEDEVDEADEADEELDELDAELDADEAEVASEEVDADPADVSEDEVAELELLDGVDEVAADAKVADDDDIDELDDEEDTAVDNIPEPRLIR